MAPSVSRATNRRSRSGSRPSGANIVALHGEVWNTADFLEIEAAIGGDKAHRLLGSFVERLDRISSTLRQEGLSGRHIRAIAHDLTGVGGQLGFKGLQHFCARMMVADDAVPPPGQIVIWLDLIQSSMRAAETYLALRALLASPEAR